MFYATALAKLVPYVDENPPASRRELRRQQKLIRSTDARERAMMPHRLKCPGSFGGNQVTIKRSAGNRPGISG